MKKILTIILVTLFLIAGCQSSPKPQGNLTTPEVQLEKGNKLEKEVAEFFMKLDKSWNDKDWVTFNFLFSEDLKFDVGTSKPWNYKTYVDSAPERREKITSMETVRFKILEKISDTSIKVECVLKRNGLDYYNIFYMKKHSLHGWQIVANERT
jgi:hypothetical protein